MSAAPSLRSFALAPLVAAIVVAAAMTAHLGWVVEHRASILRNGTEVVLRTVPIDPRDLLRGDYVVLSYGISSLPPERILGREEKAPPKSPLWVRLERPSPEDDWAVAEAALRPLEHREGSVVIRSLPLYLDDLATRRFPYFVSYGIERFYVPEGEGRPIEDARTELRVSVAVRVSESGEAQIRALLIDGEPVYNEPLY